MASRSQHLDTQVAHLLDRACRALQTPSQLKDRACSIAITLLTGRKSALLFGRGSTIVHDAETL